MTSTVRDTEGTYKLNVPKLLQRIDQWLRKRETLTAALLYAAAVMALFAPVAFLGRTLQSPLYLPHGVTDQGAYGYQGRLPVNTFNIEMSSAAYYEWPINILVGNLYRQGEAPLWNPYQGAGMPLAAQYSARVFFPYQILIDVMPTWTWDYFFLGRLWIAGLFTFLFLKLLGVWRPAAFLGGIFYMFSGAFVWFINFEQMVNVAMVAPILLWTAEGLWRWRWSTGVAGMATAVGLTLLAGQPEIAFFVLLLAASYIGFRLIGTQARDRLRMAVLAIIGAAIGVMLAAPLLMPFLELESLSWSIHGPGVTMGTQGVPPLLVALQIIFPTVFEMPTLQRFFPDNGWWDFTGGYTGILLPCLILIGGTLGFLQVKSPWRGLLLLFAGFGVVVLLKNFGFPLVLWIGNLPIFDRAWSQRWAGPAWTFSLSVAAALGLQMIRDHAMGAPLRWRIPILPTWLKIIPVSLACLAGALLILLSIIEPLWLKDIWRPYSGGGNLQPYDNAATDPYLLPSVFLGIGIALAILIACATLTKGYFHSKRGLEAIIVLALLELWFVIPQGYESSVGRLEFIPVVVGLVAVWSMFRGYRYWALGFGMAAILATLVMDTQAEHGMPDRYNAATISPYVEFLRAQEGNFRVTGGDGVLFPNFASAAGVQDVRYVAALSVGTFQEFKDKHLHLDNLWKPGGPTLWFTGGSQREVLGKECCTGYRIHRSFWEDLTARLPFYSLMGVKYILAPSVPSKQVVVEEVSLPENLLFNGSLDIWERGSGPFTDDMQIWTDGWDIDLIGDSSISISRVPIEIDTNAMGGAKVEYTHVGNEGSYVRQLFLDPDKLLGKTLNLSVWLKADRPGAVRIGMSGQGTGGAWSAYHSGNGDWERLQTNHPIASSGVGAVVILIQLTDSSTVYIADASLSESTQSYDSYALKSDFPLVYNEEISIYENPEVIPRAFLAYEVEFAASPQEALHAISDPGFDLRHRIVLEEKLPKEFSLALGKPLDLPLNGPEPHIVDYEAHRVVLGASVTQPGILVLSDQFFPGWQAWVDGVPTKIYRVDGVFRGVLLEEGDHIVEFKYLPSSFTVGVILGAIGLFICAVLFLFPWQLRGITAVRRMLHRDGSSYDY